MAVAASRTATTDGTHQPLVDHEGRRVTGAPRASGMAISHRPHGGRPPVLGIGCRWPKADLHHGPSLEGSASQVRCGRRPSKPIGHDGVSVDGSPVGHRTRLRRRPRRDRRHGAAWGSVLAVAEVMDGTSRPTLGVGRLGDVENGPSAALSMGYRVPCRNPISLVNARRLAVDPNGGSRFLGMARRSSPIVGAMPVSQPGHGLRGHCDRRRRAWDRVPRRAAYGRSARSGGTRDEPSGICAALR